MVLFGARGAELTILSSRLTGHVKPDTFHATPVPAVLGNARGKSSTGPLSTTSKSGFKPPELRIHSALFAQTLHSHTVWVGTVSAFNKIGKAYCRLFSCRDRISGRGTSAQSPSCRTGLLTLGRKPTGKPGARNSPAAFDVAGAGNQLSGAMAPVPDPTGFLSKGKNKNTRRSTSGSDTITSYMGRGLPLSLCGQLAQNLLKTRAAKPARQRPGDFPLSQEAGLADPAGYPDHRGVARRGHLTV